MSIEINCKAIAEKIEEEAREMSAKFEAKTGHTIFLMTAIANDDPASERYVRNKMKACERCGIEHAEIPFSNDDREDIWEWFFQIRTENHYRINGLMLQLPVYSFLNDKELIQLIDPAKDVDCLTVQNMGKLALGDNSFMPATVAGIMRLFKEEGYDLQGKTVVIRGRSNIVGKPLALAMINAGATVISENSHSEKYIEESLERRSCIDVIVDATGEEADKQLKCDYYIDVTTIVDEDDGKLYGSRWWDCRDWTDYREDKYTSVSRGVGLLTCAQLAWNTAYLACKQVGIEIN